MTTISINLSDELLRTSTRHAQSLHLSRAAYIRQSIERMNRDAEQRLRRERLIRASRKVRGASLQVNAEFSAIETDFNA